MVDRCRSTPWPPAASTTRSAAGSTATRSTRTGSSPTSRRCSTTRRCSCGAYLHGWLVTGTERYRRVVEETVAYVLRDLRHADGGFFSAEDADSEGVEGKFYVWSLEELEALCGDALPDVVRYFGVTARGNFEDPHTGFRGNILHAVGPPGGPPRVVRRACCRRCSRRASSACAPASTTRCCSGGTRCSCVRWPRPRTRCERDDWMDAARTNARLPAARAAPRRRSPPAVVAGRARQPARVRRGLRRAARGAAHPGRARRRARGWPRPGPSPTTSSASSPTTSAAAFFTTGRRRRGAHRAPEGLPGQRHAVGELARGRRPPPPRRAHRRRRRQPQRAEQWIATLAPVLGEHPTAFAFLLEALERLVRPPLEVAIVGDAGAGTRRARRRACAPGVLPASVRSPPRRGVGADLTPLLADRALVDGQPAAYVCEHFACRLPVTDPDALRAQLDAGAERPSASAPTTTSSTIRSRRRSGAVVDRRHPTVRRAACRNGRSVVARSSSPVVGAAVVVGVSD